jgi:ABC-type transporter Mla MlaB component
MATKDTNAGLLSKMARFVRHPTKDWSELDKPAPDSEQESGYSKQALKEMIERKRQNDFVRRREFDYLRKLRRNGPSISAEHADRPSFFQSSLASNPDERATTLKKIDEIEAQMSKQWWKGKQDEAATEAGSLPLIAKPSRVVNDGDLMTFAPTQASGLSPETDAGQGADYQSTQMGLSAPGDLAPLRMSGRSPLLAGRNKTRQGFDTGPGEFSPSKLFSTELGDGLTDPDLEEAAIRFANSDDAGAEAGLLAALQAESAQPDSADGWAAALFDLYRATGQQASFDRVAIDYAQRFGRSAPAWFSTPDLLGRKAAAPPLGPVTAAVQSSQTAWDCPAELDMPSLQAMLASLSPAAVPWRLDWRRFMTITPDAAQALAGVFATWCSQPVQLHFDGSEVLEKTLRSLTPSGDKRVDSFWWRLRLDALRILRLQDEFELAALDYCVTYEVSPPPWVDARCEYVFEGLNLEEPLESAHSDFHDGAPGDPADLSHAPTNLMGLDTLATAVVELSGEVLGDAADALSKLQAGLNGADRLVVSCARLIRVDFSAAGSILNWVAVRESEGCHVQFRDVPCLVAAFFNVIGINEHARVALRTS